MSGTYGKVSVYGKVVTALGCPCIESYNWFPRYDTDNNLMLVFDLCYRFWRKTWLRTLYQLSLSSNTWWVDGCGGRESTPPLSPSSIPLHTVLKCLLVMKISVRNIWLFCCMAAWKATFAFAQRPDVLLKRSDERLQIRSSGCAIRWQAVSQWNWVWSQKVWGTTERNSWGTEKEAKHSKQFPTGLDVGFFFFRKWQIQCE